MYVCGRGAAVATSLVRLDGRGWGWMTLVSRDCIAAPAAWAEGRDGLGQGQAGQVGRQAGRRPRPPCSGSFICIISASPQQQQVARDSWMVQPDGASLCSRLQAAISSRMSLNVLLCVALCVFVCVRVSVFGFWRGGGGGGGGGGGSRVFVWDFVTWGGLGLPLAGPRGSRGSPALPIRALHPVPDCAPRRVVASTAPQRQQQPHDGDWWRGGPGRWGGGPGRGAARRGECSVHGSSTCRHCFSPAAAWKVCGPAFPSAAVQCSAVKRESEVGGGEGARSGSRALRKSSNVGTALQPPGAGDGDGYGNWRWGWGPGAEVGCRPGRGWQVGSSSRCCDKGGRVESFVWVRVYVCVGGVGRGAG
ncbi:hypothetical protein PLESTB_000854800 [Pleodorina starrii]|uniref:Uncharacterized protein n=1 Tax=Pleodorina starrii TaxID=330485 RepID=A0A9W6BLY6_9CHLO|nr:hypothetical protein PLESTB_000854800 [Pleodorina starrii]